MTTAAFQLPLPGPQININNGGSVLNNAYSSPIVPVASDSIVHLGYKRLLTSINCTVQWYIAYRNLSSAAASNGMAISMLPTFILYKNGYPVFTSSAQIETYTYLGMGGAQFQNNNTYGVFNDFVNPIEIDNGDSISIQIQVTGYPLYAEPPDAPNTAWGVIILGGAVQPGGTLYYTEQPA